MLGKFSVPTTRGETGRKIDTWSFHGPDKTRAQIDIFLMSNDHSSEFVARSKHPLFKDHEWRHSDIQELRTRLREDIEHIVSLNTGDKWQRALKIELSTHETTKGTLGLKIDFNASPVMLDRSRPRGNRGERAVIVNGHPKTVIEVGYGENLTGTPSGGSLDEKIKEMKFIEDTPTARRVMPETDLTRKGCADIKATLEKFAELLGRTLGPDSIETDTLPSPETLADLMREAATHARRSSPEKDADPQDEISPKTPLRSKTITPYEKQ